LANLIIKVWVCCIISILQTDESPFVNRGKYFFKQVLVQVRKSFLVQVRKSEGHFKRVKFEMSDPRLDCADQKKPG
jgi:hypothetical protein